MLRRVHEGLPRTLVIAFGTGEKAESALVIFNQADAGVGVAVVHGDADLYILVLERLQFLDQLPDRLAACHPRRYRVL